MPTPPAHAITSPLKLIFTINQRLLVRALDGLSDDEFRRRSTERTNSIAWVTGHLVQPRVSMLSALGDSFDTGWGDVFKRGAEAPADGTYPDMAEMRRIAADVAERLESRLASLSESSLAAAASGPPLPGVNIVAEQIAFFAMHDSYHIGQLGYMRKALGHASLVG